MSSQASPSLDTHTIFNFHSLTFKKELATIQTVYM